MMVYDRCWTEIPELNSRTLFICSVCDKNSIHFWSFGVLQRPFPPGSSVSFHFILFHPILPTLSEDLLCANPCVCLCFYHLLNETALREADESGQVAVTAAPVSPCHPPALIPHGGQAPSWSPQNPALPICPHFPASVCLHLCFPRQIATTRQLALGCSITSFILTILLIGIGMKTDLFQSCGHCWVFQICWHIEFSTFTASSFRIWNNSAGILAPPLALFVVMLPKAHLTEHSRMSDSRWVITPSWLSGSLRSFLNSYSIYSCHLFLISSASVRSILFLSFIVPVFAWNVPLVSLIFLTQSLVFPILLLPEDVQTTAHLHSSHTR